MKEHRSHIRRLLPALALAASGAGVAALLVPAEARAVADHFIGFPDSDIRSHQARPLVLAALCFLPALGALAYSLGDTLDRYVTRRFLGIFGICITALFMIWLLMDLSNNFSDFRHSDRILATIVQFYTIRLPAILLLLLPYSLLLALIHSLGRLSTHREIIAMIQSGRGILRVTRPLIVAGMFFTLFSMGLNYHWGPVADGRQEAILDTAGGREAAEARQVLYRDASTRRLWMIGAFPANYQKGRPLLDVEVTTTDADRRIVSRLSASRALWDRDQRRWTFENPVLCRFNPGMPPEFTSPQENLVIHHWTETPWQLIKPGLSAAVLGVPDLTTWLQAHARHPGSADPAPYLTQWHYRWALPFACLVTVLLAAPLAIHFSRRGPGGGIFLAIMLSALMLLAGNIVLAFGEAGLIHPAAAAWLPNLAFATLAALLFHQRITGRPLHHALRKPLHTARS
jgi:LPS export ABC transporter permease LptG